MNTIEAYLSYLQQNPHSPYLAEAENKLIVARWENAYKIDTVVSYKKFLADNIESQFADEAIENLIAKQPAKSEELKAFKAAEALNMYFVYAQFVKKFPDCTLSYKASRMMTQFGTLICEEKIVLPVEDLRGNYHWNGEKILWKWDNKAAGIVMPGGSIMFFSDKTTNPKYGIPFSFGFSGKVFGNICMGNIQIAGPCHFEKNGLVLEKGSKIYYPL
ncbi:MAG: outer membrane protein assembly factor BamD [Desulfobulbaceae bacterium]|nr:outer membrane protein assembly factor BamD [Desulfobulbaceae bacterium]